jgi:hypothetical protein
MARRDHSSACKGTLEDCVWSDSARGGTGDGQPQGPLVPIMGVCRLRFNSVKSRM